ncbi:VCBS repeat-containing protein [Candidatus Deferrimicrobium sp.]|uniref:VCBS repeat-containing protein n=1 Tax=Candidatus Deferrimicrobium sp. TaxID=3060586 RepID=UPI002EDAD4D3
MRASDLRITCCFVLAVVLLVSSVPASPVPASAAGFPRRIAIAPFTSLTKEDIAGTVSVLPRLLGSRLMALAGADVVLLPAGASPEEKAREAKVPLLLQGTVSKLGKGYSIDASVTDLETGKPAGAFFAAAATEDDIIAQLGMLSGEIAEKLFDVKGATRAVSPDPPPAAPAPVPVAPPAIGGAPPAPPPQAAPAAAPPPTPAPTTLAGGWSPSSMKSVGESDKILDELYGVVAVETDAEGNALVAAYGKTTLHLYRVKGTEIVPFTRIAKPLEHHILDVHALDIDGDGSKEILVTDLVNETVESFVLKKKGDVYQEVAGRIPYYLVVLPDWMGKPVLVGQYQGIDAPFQGKIVALRWDGKGFAEGEKFPQDTNILPLSSGLPGLSSARFGKEWRLIYTDENSYLRVLDAGGKSRYKSSGQYGSTPDLFEWGPILPIEGRRKWFPVRNAVRVAAGGGEAPLVLIPEVKRGLLNTVGSTRLVLLQWDGREFVEKSGTPSINRYITEADFLSRDGFGKGGMIVASEIEQSGSVLKDKISRLILFRVE